MGAIASQTPVSRLFTQPFIQTQIKENAKAPRHWPLCGEFTGTGESPAQMASNAEMSPFDDVIMVWSCLDTDWYPSAVLHSHWTLDGSDATPKDISEKIRQTLFQKN